MKKLNIFASTLALLAALVGFTGCPSVHADLAESCAPEYIIGTPTCSSHSDGAVDVGWGDAWAEPLTYTDGVASFTFTYDDAHWGEGAGACAFKLGDGASSGGGFTTEYGASTVTNSSSDGYKWDLTGSNIVVKGLTENSEYTIKVTVSGATPIISLESSDSSSSSSSSSASSNLEDADVSVVNATTVVQDGAYIKLEGSNAFDGSVYAYFYGTTTATAYFETKDTFDDEWGTEGAFAAWFKFYAGDNSSLAVASKQMGAGSTDLGAAVSITNENTDNLVVKDINEGVAVYKMVVTADSAGASITITKVE